MAGKKKRKGKQAVQSGVSRETEAEHSIVEEGLLWNWLTGCWKLRNPTIFHREVENQEDMGSGPKV